MLLGFLITTLNLPLHTLFTHFMLGQVLMIMQIHVAFDTRTETSKGFAYVQYTNADAAIDAYRALDGKHFQGRLLHILPAAAKKSYKIDEVELSKLPLKKQKQIKRKMGATSSSFSWNSLYMNVSCLMHPSV